MEKIIRDAEGCTKFVATITYANDNTQIPSHYKYEYVLKGNEIVDEFSNESPEENHTADNTSNQQDNSNDKENTIQQADVIKIVYWTPNGKSYHTTKECSTLSRSKTIIEGELSSTPKTDPCDRCH